MVRQLAIPRLVLPPPRKTRLTFLPGAALVSFMERALRLRTAAVLVLFVGLSASLVIDRHAPPASRDLTADGPLAIADSKKAGYQSQMLSGQVGDLFLHFMQSPLFRGGRPLALLLAGCSIGAGAILLLAADRARFR